MTIKVPTSLEEITLSQYMSYNAFLDSSDQITDTQANKRAISIFCNLSHKEVEQIPFKDYKEIVNILTAVLTEPATDLILHYKTLSFIPNLDKISIAEYADLEVLQQREDKTLDQDKNLDRVMNILYRERVTKVLDDYKIKEYSSDDKVNPLIYEMPMSVVKSALGFFLNLREQLLTITLRYSQQAETIPQQT